MLRALTLTLLFTAGIAFTLEVYVAPKYMVWEEFDSSGEKLLEERGFLLGVGLRGDADLLTGEMEVYGGRLRYDGQTQAGDPVETDTDYLGLSSALGVWTEHGGTLKVRGEVMYRAELWVRDIKSTSNAIGYSETWFYDAVDLGLSLSRSGLYLFGRYRLLFRDARMQASLAGVPELRPKKGPSYELGAGVRGGSLGVELVYSYIKFKRSEPKPYGSGYVLQPESVRQTLSLRLISFF